MIALNGLPTSRIAQAIIELNQADLDPHALACEKTEAVRSMLLDSVEPLPRSSGEKLAWSSPNGCRNGE